MTDLEIREQVANYLAGRVNAAELEDRLETVAWDLEAEPGRTLAADVLRLLAEHSNGDWDEEELRDRLGALTRLYWFQLAPKVAWSGAASGVTRHQEQSVVVDRSRAKVSV